MSGTVADENHKALAQDTAADLPGVIRVYNHLMTGTEVATENADNGIGKKVKLTLQFHRYENPANTLIEVKDGIVTLRGNTSSEAQRELAAQYARDIEGVKEVKIDMTVVPSPNPTERTAAEKIDDASVTAQVKMALLTHRSTRSVYPRIDTRNGLVTLFGPARNAAEKELVTKIVEDLQGVRSVKNLMTVE